MTLDEAEESHDEAFWREYLTTLICSGGSGATSSAASRAPLAAVSVRRRSRGRGRR